MFLRIRLAEKYILFLITHGEELLLLKKIRYYYGTETGNI